MTIATTILAASLLGGLAPEEAPAEAKPAVEAVMPAVVEVAPAPAVAEPALAVAEAAPAATEAAPAVAEAAPAAEEKPAGKKAKTKEPKEERSVRITSERTDYDRKEGVIMFDGDVKVDDEEYLMCSDKLYVFLDGTNELKRIVAIGNVAITNEMRRGWCSKAAYTKSVGKVVMYGDGADAPARLVDEGKRRSEVAGKKITFWIDSEQVEVEGSTVTLDAGGIGGKDGAKKLLGK